MFDDESYENENEFNGEDEGGEEATLDTGSMESIENYISMFCDYDWSQGVELWIPSSGEGWDWYREFFPRERSYQDYVTDMTIAAQTIERNGHPVKITTATVPAIRQEIEDLGLPCGNLVDRVRSVYKVIGSPFIQLEEDLIEAGLRAGFPPDDDAPLGRPTMND